MLVRNKEGKFFEIDEELLKGKEVEGPKMKPGGPPSGPPGGGGGGGTAYLRERRWPCRAAAGSSSKLPGCSG